MKLSSFKLIAPIIPFILLAAAYGLIQSNKSDNRSQNVSEAVIGITSKHWVDEDQVIEKKGSGFIISKEGLIVTAAHVLGNQLASYGILFDDGTKLPADKVFEDPELDIALLKLVAPQNSDFPYFALGETKNLQKGNQVSAYFFDQEHEVIKNDGVFEGFFVDPDNSQNFLQNTVSIIKSGSGGPLLNKEGKVIGINVGILRENSGTLSVPVEVVQESLKRVD